MRRAAVQHLALFVPWEQFLSDESGDINAIWDRERRLLSPRLCHVVENIQLLRRSAEDARRDAKQWAAMSGETDHAAKEMELDGEEDDGVSGDMYRGDNVGSAIRLIDVLRSMVEGTQITAGSREVMTVVQQLCRFQQVVLGSSDELRATVVSEGGTRTMSVAGGGWEGTETPRQELVRSIKSQEKSLSRERERMIQGIQEPAKMKATGHRTAVYSVLNSFGEDEVEITSSDSQTQVLERYPRTSIQFGPSTSFSEGGRQLAESYTLNRRQAIALQLLCRQLDQLDRGEGESPPQLCQFLGGEGGTGKSRIIEAVVELFANKGISHRLLVTATSGTAAANISGITIHSACGFSIDTSQLGSKMALDRFGLPSSIGLWVDGETRMDWQEKYLLIIDEVSMLGVRTLYAVNEKLCQLRGSTEDFGGIPIVLFSGDYHQFRPV